MINKQLKDLVGKKINIEQDNEIKKAIIVDIEENEDGTQNIVFKFEGEDEDE